MNSETDPSSSTSSEIRGATKPKEDAKKPPPSLAIAVAALLVVSTGASIVVLGAARPVRPVELPALNLDREAVAKVLKEDERLVRINPQGADIAHSESLYYEQNIAEIESDTMEGARFRRREISELILKIRRDSGDETLLALRARALAEFENTIAGRKTSHPPEHVVSSFPKLLERYLFTERGIRRAPEFAIRTLFKVRWNTIHDLDPSFGLSRVELRAHHGWFALHVAGAPLDARLSALSAYEAAGGTNVAESRGILLSLTGAAEQAVASLDEAFAKNANVRIRNLALGVAADNQAGATP